MHRQIDVPGEQRLFDLLREEPVAADLGKQAVLHTVASRADGHNLDRSHLGKLGGICRNQPVPDNDGLAQRHWTAAGADAERTGGQGRSPVACDYLSGNTGRVCIKASQNTAKPIDMITIGTPARACSTKVSFPPIRSARSTISTLVRLPVKSRLPARLDNRAKA